MEYADELADKKTDRQTDISTNELIDLLGDFSQSQLLHHFITTFIDMGMLSNDNIDINDNILANRNLTASAGKNRKFTEV